MADDEKYAQEALPFILRNVGVFEFLGKEYTVVRTHDSTMGDGICVEVVSRKRDDFDENVLLDMADYFGTNKFKTHTIAIDPCSHCGKYSKYGVIVYFYSVTRNNPFGDDNDEALYFEKRKFNSSPLFNFPIKSGTQVVCDGEFFEDGLPRYGIVLNHCNGDLLKYNVYIWDESFLLFDKCIQVDVEFMRECKLFGFDMVYQSLHGLGDKFLDVEEVNSIGLYESRRNLNEELLRQNGID